MKSSRIEQEVIEMQRLNIELMDALVIIGNRFMDYCQRHNITIDGLKSLETLIARAEKLVNEVVTPYYGNPIRPSDDNSHSNSPDDKVPPPRARADNHDVPINSCRRHDFDLVQLHI